MYALERAVCVWCGMLILLTGCVQEIAGRAAELRDLFFTQHKGLTFPFSILREIAELDTLIQTLFGQVTV